MDRRSMNFPLGGRSSMLLNEDEYDYAIELRPDDEYRQAAETLPDIVDFDDVDMFLENFHGESGGQPAENIENDSLDCKIQQFHPFEPARMSVLSVEQEHRSSLANTSRSPQQHSGENSSSSPSPSQQYDTHITSIGTGPLPTGGENPQGRSAWSVISRGEFSFRLNMLDKHKKWVEKAARRSSIGFHREHLTTEKETMDKFLVTLARGVHVRRHQSGKVAETVRLFSSTGCRTIEWTRPEARDLLAQRKMEGVHAEGRTDAIFLNKHDRNLFDCCITICGCGDDLVVGNDSRQEESVNVMAEHDEASFAGSSRCLFNFGFKRRGCFEELDILAVQSASKEDPTELGSYGTEALRSSRDVFNQELTFSLVIRDGSQHGFSTLDLECDTTETYYLLVLGFRLLLEEAEALRPAEEQRGGRFNKRLAGLVDAYKFTKQLIFDDASPKNADPIAQLFESNSCIDPLRALRVGGGLFAESHKSSPQKHSRASPSSSPLKTAGQQQSAERLPPARFLGWNAAGTQIWARLRMAGLKVKCVFSWDLSRVILKIKCPSWRLEEMAEQMHLKLKSRDGHLKQFKVSRRDTFIPLGAAGTIFRSSERQQIIDYIIRSKIKDGGAELDENTQLGSHIVQRFPLHMYSRLEDIRHSWVTFWKRERPGQVAASWSPFAEGYGSTYFHMRSAVEHFFNNLLTQPLDSIAEYFGESIAFYFAYMAFYTRWLVFPSVLGLVVFIVQCHDRTLDHWLCTMFGVVVTVWACFMLAFWRQKAAALAYRWGVLDFETEETERPQFQGSYVYDETSGEVRKSYSMWRRLGKYVVSIPVQVLAILAVLVVMTTIFTTQTVRADQYESDHAVDYAPVFPTSAAHFADTSSGSGANDWRHVSASTSSIFAEMARSLAGNGTSTTASAWSRPVTLRLLNDPEFWSVTFLYPSLYGVLVSVMTTIFHVVALWLNDFENHRTQTTYMNRLILKVFSFQFVTVFTSLYYYAFFMADKEGAYMRMCVTIFSLMTVGQWWSVAMDLCLPAIYHNALLYRMKANFATTNRKIYKAREHTEGKGKGHSAALAMLDKRNRYLSHAKSKCWEEALCEKYNNFSDYTAMVIQIGFVLCFSAVFPLTPLLALLNNLALIRFNANKICYTRQRPIAQKIGGIGVWEDVLQVMSVGGILTNCALMGVTSTQLHSHLAGAVGSTGIAVVLFGYEQVLLLFKYWLHCSIPRVPPSVQRAQFRERKSIDRKSLLRSKKAGKSTKKDSFARNLSFGWFDGGPDSPHLDYSGELPSNMVPFSDGFSDADCMAPESAITEEEETEEQEEVGDELGDRWDAQEPHGHFHDAQQREQYESYTAKQHERSSVFNNRIDGNDAPQSEYRFGYSRRVSTQAGFGYRQSRVSFGSVQFTSGEERALDPEEEEEDRLSDLSCDEYQEQQQEQLDSHYYGSPCASAANCPSRSLFETDPWSVHFSPEKAHFHTRTSQHAVDAAERTVHSSSPNSRAGQQAHPLVSPSPVPAVKSWFWPTASASGGKSSNRGAKTLNIAPLQSVAKAAVTKTPQQQAPLQTQIEMRTVSPAPKSSSNAKKQSPAKTMQSHPVTTQQPSYHRPAAQQQQQQQHSMNSTAEKLRRFQSDAAHVSQGSGAAQDKRQAQRQQQHGRHEPNKLPAVSMAPHHSPLRDSSVQSSVEQPQLRSPEVSGRTQAVADRWKQGISSTSTRHLFPPAATSPFSFVEQQQQQQQQQQQLSTAHMSGLPHQSSSHKSQLRGGAAHLWEQQENLRNQGNTPSTGTQHPQGSSKLRHVIYSSHLKPVPSSTNSGSKSGRRESLQNPFNSLVAPQLQSRPERVAFD